MTNNTNGNISNFPPKTSDPDFDRGPQNRSLRVDLVCRPDYMEATIIHVPSNTKLTERVTYADYQDGTIWPRESEAQGVLFNWLADNFEYVGHDDKQTGTRRSRQYLVSLTQVEITHCYRVYSDRSVEWGNMIAGNFEPLPRSLSTTDPVLRRKYVAELLTLSRQYGYEITQEAL